jgi:hypothetical protein
VSNEPVSFGSHATSRSAIEGVRIDVKSHHGSAEEEIAYTEDEVRELFEKGQP